MAENVNEALIANAIGGGGGAADDIRKKLVLAMLQEGTSGAPVAHFTQGLDRIAKAMLGGLELRDLDRSDRVFQRSQGDYLRDRFGVGGNDRPAGPAPTGGPRPPGAPPLASLPPMGVDPEPPRNPPGTFPVRQATEGLDIPMPSQPRTPGGGFPARDPAQIAQALMGGGGGVNLANVPGGPGSPEDMGPPLRPPSGAAALAAPMPPRPDPTMALTAPQQPAGAIPPPLAPPGPPAVDQRPLTPPAPRAAQVAQPSDMTPEQRRRAIGLLGDRRTSPAVRKQIEEDLSPDFKFQVAGDRLYRVSKNGRFEEVADATKSPDAIRIAREVLGNPRQYGYSGPDDPQLKRDLQYRISGLQAPDSKFSEKAAGVLTERYGKLLDMGTQAQETIANIQSLRDIGSRITTGKKAEITAALGPWAELAGVKIEGLSDLQAFEAVVNGIAPKMRVPGSGAQSDFEMRNFLKSLAGLGKTPEGNEIINRTLEAIMEHRMAVANIGSRVLAEEIKPQEAERIIRQLPDPLTLWKQNRPGQSPASAGGARSGLPRYNPETGRIER